MGSPEIPGLRCASTWALESRPCGAQDRKKSGPPGPDTFLECESQFSVCGPGANAQRASRRKASPAGKLYPPAKPNSYPARRVRFSWNRGAILTRLAELGALGALVVQKIRAPSNLTRSGDLRGARAFDDLPDHDRDVVPAAVV
jgi:hypothetical protein